MAQELYFRCSACGEQHYLARSSSSIPWESKTSHEKLQEFFDRHYKADGGSCQGSMQVVSKLSDPPEPLEESL